MHHLSELPGRTVQIAGEPWLYFSGTGYLGAGWNPDLQRLVLEGMQQYGLHFGGSRLSNIRLDIFEETETFLANYTGAEKALLLSSGTLAGQLAIRTLAILAKYLPRQVLTPPFGPMLRQFRLPGKTGYNKFKLWHTLPAPG